MMQANLADGKTAQKVAQQAATQLTEWTTAETSASHLSEAELYTLAKKVMQLLRTELRIARERQG